MSFRKIDPKYHEFSASLRDDKIFVKMPLSKAQRLVDIWENFQSREVKKGCSLEGMILLIKDELEACKLYGSLSLFYQVPTQECLEDIENLKSLETEDSQNLLQDLRKTLELGVKDSSEVDWIARVGGPGKKNLDNTEENISQDTLLEMLF